MYVALIRASDTWKRIVITEFELRQLEQLREHLNERHAERTAPAVKSAFRSRISRRNRRRLAMPLSAGHLGEQALHFYVGQYRSVGRRAGRFARPRFSSHGSGWFSTSSVEEQ
jgi:hypothetical protein